MKRHLLIAGLALLAAAASAETVYLPSFSPVTPEVKAQGGSFTAISHGYNALFTNPAGFGADQGSLTLVSINPTLNLSFGSIRDVVDNSDAIATGDPITILQALQGIITTDGLGIGVNGGAGLVGGGLGIGAAVQGSVYAKGTTLLGTQAVADVTEAAVVGLAFPLDLLFTKLKVGFDVRPMQRTFGSFGVTDVANLGNLSFANGFGMAYDAGAMIDLGPLTLGISARDIGGTKFDMKSYGFNALVAAKTFTNGNGGDLADSYEVPMTLSYGLAIVPDLGLLGFLVQPSFHADVQMPIYTDDTPAPSILASSHFGAEVKLLSFVSVRAGLNQGYATLGLGAHLLFLDVNLAYYADETGRYAGEGKKGGITAEASLRF